MILIINYYYLLDESEPGSSLLVEELSAFQLMPEHVNIERFHGFSNHPIYGKLIITEFLPQKILKQYLKHHRRLPSSVQYENLHPQSVTLTVRQIVTFALQIVSGMKHITDNKVRIAINYFYFLNCFTILKYIGTV